MNIQKVKETSKNSSKQKTTAAVITHTHTADLCGLRQKLTCELVVHATNGTGTKSQSDS